MDIPTFSELFRLVPIVTIVVGVISLGFVVGFRSREDHIKNLLEFLRNRKDKDKSPPP
jgi:hypothetical protein